MSARPVTPLRQALIALGLSTLLVSAPAHGGALDGLLGFSDTGNVEYWTGHKDKPMKWGEWDYISFERRKGAEAGAPSSHPATVGEQQVASLLAAVRIGPEKAGQPAKPLFTEDEINRLAPAIAAGLAVATPEEDIVFLTSGRRDFKELFGRMANAARVFVADGQFNIIVGTQLSDALMSVRPGTKAFLDLSTGSRAKLAKDVHLATVSGGQLKREDWVVLPLGLQAAPVTAATPVTPATAVAAPAAATAAPAAADAESDAFFKKQSARLKGLKSMRDQGLISEEEFQAKRAEILQGL
ncbi:SHOCT domain-containing protein [Niveibacterium sp. SC-1]|uniref:SHOCT domain-containing protein n=1 Tax=Niveibacterium sp. SC-1 TaxID=3135646 RepID=UPI00311D86AC